MTDSLCRKQKLADSFIPCDQDKRKQYALIFAKQTNHNKVAIPDDMLYVQGLGRINNGSFYFGMEYSRTSMARTPWEP